MSAGSRARHEAGMIGKMLVVWLLILALVAVVTVDGVSVVIARLHTADVAGNAASEAAANYRLTHDVRRACSAASDSIAKADPKVRLRSGGCTIDVRTGDATITVHRNASTLIAGRLGLTKRLASISVTETSPPPTL